MARPNKYDPIVLAEQLDVYIDSTDDPQLAEFCLPRNMPCRDTINELSKNCKELSDSLKRMYSKQEVYLSRCGNGELHSTMCIFRLKQPVHGYTDKQQIDQNISGALEINVNVVEE